MPVPHAQHVRKAPAGEDNRSTESANEGWIRRRRESGHGILDVDEVPANRPDSIEVLGDLVDRVG